MHMRIARYYLCMIVCVYCLCLYRTLGKRIFVELVPLLCGLCGAGSHQANQASSTWLAILERGAYSTCLSFREHFSGEVWCPKNFGNCWWIWSTVGQNMLNNFDMTGRCIPKLRHSCQNWRKGTFTRLVGGLEHVLFSIIYGIILPI